MVHPLKRKSDIDHYEAPVQEQQAPTMTQEQLALITTAFQQLQNRLEDTLHKQEECFEKIKQLQANETLMLNKISELETFLRKEPSHERAPLKIKRSKSSGEKSKI